jgi:flagellar protein FliL
MEVNPMSESDSRSKSKDEAKPKMESKPIVETKTAGDPVRKSRKLWIMVGILVVVAAVGSAAFLAYPHFGGSRNVPKEKSGQESRNARVKAILPLDSFLVNLADAENICFVKATFQLGLEEEWTEESKNSVAIASMRDSIISLLSSKTAQQIMTSQGKDKLREEIRSRMNGVSPKKVIEVYIVDFVVQL